ncbi:MAG: hypothetical protein JWR40_4708 [Massilia sp.]|nr:hypothetical protein [Massilia sp.]
MMRALSWAGLFLVFALRVSGAHAAQACPAPGSWDCLGLVEIRVGERAFRMSRYANDEMLAEIEAKSDSKRYFVAQPSGSELYFGLSPQEFSSPGANPFVFFDYAFAGPVAALRLAYLDGPSSVAASAAKRDVVVGGSPATIRASKRGDGRIDFQLETAAAGPIAGFLVPTLLQPLDGGYRLTGWERKSGPRLDSLNDARLSRKQ